jgi:hypothetical protein
LCIGGAGDLSCTRGVMPVEEVMNNFDRHACGRGEE